MAVTANSGTGGALAATPNTGTHEMLAGLADSGTGSQSSWASIVVLDIVGEARDSCAAEAQESLAAVALWCWTAQRIDVSVTCPFF